MLDDIDVVALHSSRHLMIVDAYHLMLEYPCAWPGINLSIGFLILVDLLGSEESLVTGCSGTFIGGTGSSIGATHCGGLVGADISSDAAFSVAGTLSLCGTMDFSSTPALFGSI